MSFWLNLPTIQIDPVAALSLEVDEEKVTQWQRPGLGIVLGLGLRRLKLMYSLDINFIKERPEFKPSRSSSSGRSKLFACREFVSTIFGARLA